MASSRSATSSTCSASSSAAPKRRVPTSSRWRRHAIWPRSVWSPGGRQLPEICHANHELHVAEHSLQLQQRSRTVTERLIAAGRGTPPELARANAQVALLEAALPPLHAQRSAAAYSLAALLGQTPGQLPAGVIDCAHAPGLAQPLPVGDGRALLQRRPDVRQAERKLASATARIGVATAELYPDIRLGASVGAAGLLEDFGTPMTQQWSIGPLISWTLPSSGTHARIHAAEAGADAARPSSTTPFCKRCARPRPRWTATRRTCAGCSRCASRRNRPHWLPSRTAGCTRVAARRTCPARMPTAAGHQRCHPGRRRSAGLTRPDPSVPVLGGGWQASTAAAGTPTAAK